MKIKQRPDDFHVEELTGAIGGTAGPFAFYRLDKTGWTTPDALQIVCDRWRVDWEQLSFGGLKDRHAVTSQFFTILRGPKRGLEFERLSVTHLGQRMAAFTAADIRANRFTIALRNLTPAGVASAAESLREVADVGVPNYFDDQRFGSVGEGREFIGREMVHNRFERALWLALAEPYEFDREEEKRIKETLRHHWNDWPACRAKLPRCHERSLVEYLAANPAKFMNAIARLRPELQGLYLAAYQSFLWNRMLGVWLTRNLPAADLATLDLKVDRLPVPRKLTPELRRRWESLTLPLPSARVKAEPDSEWAGAIEEVLREEGLKLSELRLKHLRRPFFSKGDRSACIRPAAVTYADEADELHAGQRKLMLRFELPKGSYATMLVKRITDHLT